MTDNASRALARADAFLAAAEAELPSLADALSVHAPSRDGTDSKALMTKLGNLLAGLGSLAGLAVELERIGIPVTAELDLARLSDSLRQMIRCQESGDWPGVSEALRARIAPLLPVWRSTLARHAGLLSGEPAASSR